VGFVGLRGFGVGGGRGVGVPFPAEPSPSRWRRTGEPEQKRNCHRHGAADRPQGDTHAHDRARAVG